MCDTFHLFPGDSKRQTPGARSGKSDPKDKKGGKAAAAPAKTPAKDVS